MCKAVCNPSGLAGISNWRDQLKEYPSQTVKDMEIAAGIFEFLSEYPDVEVKPVSALSLRGLWLAIKHKLPRGLWAIVEGVVIDASSESEAVDATVRKLRSKRTAFALASKVEAWQTRSTENCTSPPPPRAIDISRRFPQSKSAGVAVEQVLEN